MRPIDRGQVPLDAEGNPKVFKKYADARGDLIDRIGEYCSYCEMHQDASLAVEHVKPKKHNPHLELEWDNFLLSCVNCNSIKGSDDIDLDDYYWPDRDNTARAFEYQEGGIVRANPALNMEQQEKTKRTIKLTGLDRRPSNDSDPATTDRRWRNRREEWDKAVDSWEDLRQEDSPTVRRLIVRGAVKYWSVWMTVFRNDADMLRRLIEALPGTCRACFDENNHFEKVHRPGGAI